MSCCINIHRWGTYTLQTGRQVHTPEGQWSDGGSLADVSSFYLLCQGRLQGCRAAAGPPRASESNDIVQGKPQQTPLWPGILHTFSTLKTLQLHGFLLHFLLSTGFREVSRIWLVDSVDGKSGLYSDSETHKHTHATTENLNAPFWWPWNAGLPYSCWTFPSNKQGTSSSEESDEWSSAKADDAFFLNDIYFFFSLAACLCVCDRNLGQKCSHC